MPQQRPLRDPEEGVGFNVRSSRARADTAQFIFYQKFSDKGSAEADNKLSCGNGLKVYKGEIMVKSTYFEI